MVQLQYFISHYKVTKKGKDRVVISAGGFLVNLCWRIPDRSLRLGRRVHLMLIVDVGSRLILAKYKG